MEWWQDVLAIVRVDQVALAGIVTWGIIMLFRGRLHPNGTVVDLRRERDTWKEAFLKSAEAGRVKDAQISELIEHSRTTAYAFRSLPGGDDVGQTSPPDSGT